MVDALDLKFSSFKSIGSSPIAGIVLIVIYFPTSPMGRSVSATIGKGSQIPK